MPPSCHFRDPIATNFHTDLALAKISPTPFHRTTEPKNVDLRYRSVADYPGCRGLGKTPMRWISPARSRKGTVEADHILFHPRIVSLSYALNASCASALLSFSCAISTKRRYNEYIHDMNSSRDCVATVSASTLKDIYLNYLITNDITETNSGHMLKCKVSTNEL